MDKNILSNLDVRLRQMPCHKIQKMLKRQLDCLEQQRKVKTEKYEELVKRLHQLKVYDRYFERPSTIWAQTCLDEFYGYMFADEEKRKELNKIDWFLKYRIAASVAYNRGYTDAEFSRKNFRK